MIKHLALCATLLIFAFFTHAFAIFFILNNKHPLNLRSRAENFAVAIVADDGTPLRSFPDSKGVWRYPVTLDQISPLYLEALINYEDRYFWHHPGVNPLALLRALGQFVQTGRLLSGGSTLTMQTARILHPHPRNIWGKIQQMFRAFQLEFYLSKKEILTLYLNYAPFGGPIEGVQAASFAYLGKSAKLLSHAEAALLAVLPQAPSRIRPDRHPKRAARARNKVLNRMVRFGIWDKITVKEAKIEQVAARFDPRPMSAPLLARRLKSQATPSAPVKTFIDPMLQSTVRDLIQGFIANTPEHTSAAALVVENQNLAVRAYVGSAIFLDNSRFGHVDMAQAIRSPGSTLKPFLYAIAIEEGLIHSESLLVDAPFSFSGYRPDNFTRHFTGPVSASEALRRSLNIPAVDLMERIGPNFFDARLRQGGLSLKYPPHQGPNLTMILGGVGVSLERLVGAYTAFARQGLAGAVRLTQDQPMQEQRLLSAGAAYIVRRILQENPRPDLPAAHLRMDRSRQVAWKTGTSYGLRDAWTIGITDNYTIGVWVGRPDGTPSPGQYGRATAAPLLFQIADSLPRQYSQHLSIPDTVSRRQICWPLGTLPKSDTDSLCHERRQAWIFRGLIPPTFPDRSDKHWQANPISIMINPKTGLRVQAECLIANPMQKQIAQWPKAAGPWLSPRLRRQSKVPKLDPVCGILTANQPESIHIIGIEPDMVLRPAGSQTRLPSIMLQAQGGQNHLYWILNGELIAQTPAGLNQAYQFEKPGRYQLTVMDTAANYDSVRFTVLGGYANN